MTDGGPKRAANAIWQRLLSVNGIIVLFGLLALVIGLFIGSNVGRVVSALILLGSMAAAFLRRKGRSKVARPTEFSVHDAKPHGGNMKKPYFDDFQPPTSHYVVKESSDAENIVPSDKSTKAVKDFSKQETIQQFQVSDFFDLDSEVLSTGIEPQSEFNLLMNKVLQAMKDLLFAHTVAFFWANREKRQMVLEAVATDSKTFITTKRFNMGEDVLSQVADDGSPKLLGRVNHIAERELIPYYTESEQIRSLASVPVFYFNGVKDRQPTGVLVVDSKAEDAFGLETLSVLGNFTKLVSSLVKSYTDKYDMLMHSELLSSIRRMNDRVKSDPSEVQILDALADESNRLVNWDVLTIVMYNEEKQAWVLDRLLNKFGSPHANIGQEIDFTESVVGEAIKNHSVQQLEDVAGSPRIRYFRGEIIDRIGSLVSIPIASFNRCYGAVTVESRRAANFSGSDVETMYRLVENAAAALEVVYMNHLVKDTAAFDQPSGSFTNRYFGVKVSEEIQRAEDFGTELALVSIAVDNVEDHLQRYGKEGFESILHQIVHTIRTSIRTYDCIGRQGIDKLNVMLIHTPASDAYVWAEKIRKQVASQVLAVGGKTLSVTLSAGVCGLMDGMEKDELIAGTSQVLNKAVEIGGNVVQVY